MHCPLSVYCDIAGVGYAPRNRKLALLLAEAAAAPTLFI